MEKVSNKNYTNSGNIPLLAEIVGKNMSILDIGCGSGSNASILSLDGHIVDGITLSNTEADMAKKYMRNIFISNLEAGLPILNNTYDFILCSHVLEHIAYPQNLYKDLLNIMTNETKLIIALPNVMHYKSRYKLLKGKFDYEDSGIWDYTHLRWYTYNSAKDNLIKSGFNIEKSYVSGDIPFLRLTKILPIFIRKKIFIFLTSISRGLFGWQLIYVVTKKI